MTGKERSSNKAGNEVVSQLSRGVVSSRMEGEEGEEGQDPGLPMDWMVRRARVVDQLKMASVNC